nr:Gag-Pol polyprotein [Tanacetum cinerariifolium]
MEKSNNANVGKFVSERETYDGEELLRSVTTRINKRSRKGDVNANASQTSLFVADMSNPCLTCVASKSDVTKSIPYTSVYTNPIETYVFQSTSSTQHDIISELFGVSLKTYKDFEDFINNIELGKNEVWLELFEEKRQEVPDTLCVMFKAFKEKNLNDSIPSKVSPSDPIRKAKSMSTNGGLFVGPSIKPNVRYVPKAITSAPKKGATNVGNASKSSTMLKTTDRKMKHQKKLDISFLHVSRDLCYPKNDREDIERLGAKGDIGFFIGYSANSCAYQVYNRRTRKIMETMNVTFDDLSTMDFEQRGSKPDL